MSSWTKRLKQLIAKFPSKVKAVPLIFTSLVFNFSVITLMIINIINNNFFFVLYMFAAFISILLPATFSPAESVKKIEEKMGLSANTGESYEIFRRPPTSRRNLIKNLSRAFNVAYTNVFCITRPIGNSTSSVRHFMIGLYPLHFVVNMTTLVFERYFSESEVIAIRGQIFKFNFNFIFSYNIIVLVGILTGLANLKFFLFFYYPDFFVGGLTSIIKRVYDGMAVMRSRSKRVYDGLTKRSAVALTSTGKHRTNTVTEKVKIQSITSHQIN